MTTPDKTAAADKQEPKPEIKPVAKLLAFKPGEPIPIRALHLQSGKNQVGIPGKTMGSSVHFEQDGKTNRDRWTIYFVPHLRHYLVTFYKGGGSDYTQTVMIPEGCVTQAHPQL